MNLTTKMIEEKFNISRQTLHNWINEGLLPAPKKILETGMYGQNKILIISTKLSKIKQWKTTLTMMMTLC